MMIARGKAVRGALLGFSATCTLALSAVGAFGALAAPATLRPGASATVTSTPIALTQPTDPQLGALTPSAGAASKGMFGPQLAWPILPIHAALTRNGHLISYGTPAGDGTKQAGILFDNWDPAAGASAAAHVDSDSMGYDSFCNSLVALADGNLLMVGGNSTMSTMTYNPWSGQISKGPNVNRQRWYATTLRLTSGKVLVLGGTDYYDNHSVTGLPPKATTGTMPEVGDGAGPWRTLPNAANTSAFGRAASRWFYPRAFNGPHGTVVGISNNQLWELTATGKGKVNLTGKIPFKPAAAGSQVMYAPGKVLVASGGNGNPEKPTVALSQAATVDFNGSTPKVRTTGSVRHPGNWLNLTVLPSGEVFKNGGTGVGTRADTAQHASEIWNPATGKWRTAATALRIRTYHSVSLLLPSGAIFTGGSGAAPATPGSTLPQENNLNAELYYPAYLFTKNADGTVRWASRPKITSISGSATYGGTVHLGLTGAAKIKGASLISLPSVTHSENTDQRRIPLTIKQRGRTVSATLPKSLNTLPPGDYELTVTSTTGVPSPAQIVTLRAGKPGLVTLAGGTTGQTATGEMDHGAHG